MESKAILKINKKKTTYFLTWQQKTKLIPSGTIPFIWIAKEQTTKYQKKYPYFCCMTNKILLAVLFVVAILNANGQKSKTKGDEPDKNISTFLNDGRVKGVNNLIRIRLAPTFMGYMGASYERKFGEKFGLELGANVKINKSAIWEEYREANFNAPFGTEYIASKNGIGFILFPKYYKYGKYINNGRYIGLQANLRLFKSDFNNYVPSAILDTYASQSNVSCSYKSLFLVWGNQRHFGSRFTFGLELGFGVNQDKINNLNEYSWNSGTSTSVINKINVKHYQITGLIDLSFGILL